MPDHEQPIPVPGCSSIYVLWQLGSNARARKLALYPDMRCFTQSLVVCPICSAYRYGTGHADSPVHQWIAVYRGRAQLTRTVHTIFRHWMGLLGRTIRAQQSCNIGTNSWQLSAAILSSAVCIFYLASDPEDRYKMLIMSNTLFWSSMRLDIAVCLTAVSALFCVCLVYVACIFEAHANTS